MEMDAIAGCDAASANALFEPAREGVEEDS
jgi:hypothetical protein